MLVNITPSPQEQILSTSIPIVCLNASAFLPSSSRRTPSIVAVENVENPPKNPVDIILLVSGVIAPEAHRGIVRPTKKQAKTFTVIVPTGIDLLDLPATKLSSLNLLTAPSPAARLAAMRVIIGFIIFHFQSF